MSQDHNHLTRDMGVQVLCQFMPKCRRRYWGKTGGTWTLNSRSLPQRKKAGSRKDTRCPTTCIRRWRTSRWIRCN